MKYAMLSVIMLVALASILPASADTFSLKDGKTVDGTILRTAGSKVTLKTKSGISTYDILQFDEKTRVEHFRNIKAAERSQPKRTSTAGSANPGEPIHKAVLGLMIAGAVFCVIGSLWFIVAGFAESVGWGIALILFNGIAGLAFLILHWDRAKSPVLTYLLGIALIIGAALLGK
jgi:hypothetical protein